MKLLQDDKLAFLDGQGLCVWDTKANDRKHIWSEERGFAEFTTNFRRDLLAVAEYAMNPPVHLYDAQLNHLHTFKNLCDLDISDLYIEYNGNYLVVVTGCPNYDIRICDIKEKTM